MSPIFEGSRAHILIADYVSIDESGKMYVVGGGVQVIGYVPQSGTTAGFAIAWEIQAPPDAYGQEFSQELTLRTRSGEVVEIPGPAGPQKMRIANVARIERPRLPGVPEDAVPPVVRGVVYFANGLPLPPGEPYYWEVGIDGESKDDWKTYMYVNGVPRPPVFG